MKNPILEVRNKVIAARIEAGEKQIDIAKEFGISRERVRQIYEKYGNITYSILIHQRIKESKRVRLKELSKTIKYHCIVCNTPVYVLMDGKRSSGHSLCQTCRIDQKENRRDIYRKLICDLCEKEYRPYYSKRFNKAGNNFCDNTCYFKFKKLYAKSNMTKRTRRILRRQYYTIKYYKQKLAETRAKLKKPTIKYKTLVKTKIVKIPKVIVKKEIDKPLKKQPQPVYKKGLCQKCGMVLAGEFEHYKSKKNPQLCYVCDEGIYGKQTESFTGSGLINGKFGE